MKKILFNILLALFVLFPVSVLAEGYVSVSPSSLTIEQGSSKTFTITAYNAIGDVSIQSNNSGIASVSTGEWGTGMVEEKVTKTGSITVTGKSIGTTTITLTIDAATFAGDDLAGQTKTVTVNVVAKPAPQPDPKPNNPQPNNPKPNNPQPQQPQKSTNNNLKSLIVEGYELVKVDNNNYTLTVTNDVTSISVNATAEDSKAKVTGIGAKELVVGENNIEVIITSESGTQNKINIKVTRKEGYYLEDLDFILKNNKIQDADIIVNNDSKISKEDITKIKESKKTLRLNYYDENKKLLYSWSINGKEIKESKEFSTLINFTADNTEEIYKISNYADGIYINFEHDGALPTGTKVKLYVGEKFANESIVNLYHYNKTEKLLESIKEGLIVKGGYIEFDLEHCSDYFVTMSTIGSVNDNTSSSSNMLLIVIIVAILIIIGLVTFIVIKFKPNNKNNLVNEVENTPINPIDNFANNEMNQETITNIDDNLNVDNDKNLFNDKLNETENLNTHYLSENKDETLQVNNFDNFNKVESKQEFSTNLNNNMNSLNNNVNEIQNSNIDSSNNNSLY